MRRTGGAQVDAGDGGHAEAERDMQRQHGEMGMQGDEGNMTAGTTQQTAERHAQATTHVRVAGEESDNGARTSESDDVHM